MKVAIALTLVLQGINAHFKRRFGFRIRQHTGPLDCFPRIIVNNRISKQFQYVRDGTGSRFYPPFLASLPIKSPDSPGVVCGNGLPGGHEGIETATVIAGEQVGFMVAEKWTEVSVLWTPYSTAPKPSVQNWRLTVMSWTAQFDDQPYIWHEGPGQIALSPLPSTDISPSAISRHLCRRWRLVQDCVRWSLG
jgi:hypothetical protein